MSAQPHNSYSACVNTLRGAVYYDRVDLFTLPERIDKSMQNVRLFVIFNIFPGLNGKWRCTLRWICIVWSVFSWKPWTGEILRERPYSFSPVRYQ